MRTGRTRPTRSLTVASPTLILDMAARRQAPLVADLAAGVFGPALSPTTL